MSSPDLVSLIRRGKYFVRASAASGVVATTVAANAAALTSSLSVVTPALPAVLPLAGEIDVNPATTRAETLDYTALAVVGLIRSLHLPLRSSISIF